MANNDIKNNSKFDINGIPSLKEALPLGIQHVMAMIVGNMVPAFLIASIIGLSSEMTTMLVQGSMLAAAIGTFIQLYPLPFFGKYKIGSRLPVMMGMSYVFLGAALSVAAEYGFPALLGGQLIASILGIFIGIYVRRIRKYFTPVISGTIVTCMGIGLFPVAIHKLAGGLGSPSYGNPINFAIGLFVAFLIIFINKFGKGLLKDTSILIGIVAGYILCLSLGMIDFSAMSSASWISLPKPLAFGLEFRWEVIAILTLIFTIGIVDIMGGYTIITLGAFNREVTDQELSSGVIGVAAGSIISSVFGGLPVAVFSQNAAIVAMNKVVSRYVIAIGAIFLLLTGISPKIGALMATVPSAVIGGAILVVFGMITMAGIMLLTMFGFDEETKIIAGIAITLSIGVTSAPQVLEQFHPMIQTLVGGSSIVAGTVVAFLLQGTFGLIKSLKVTKTADKLAKNKV